MQELSRLHILLMLPVFVKGPTEKNDPRKVDKNNRESMFCLFVFFQHIWKKTKSFLPLFYSLCFSNGPFNHTLAKGADHIIVIISLLSLRCVMTVTWLVTSRTIQLFYWHLAIKVFSDLEMLIHVFVIVNRF